MDQVFLALAHLPTLLVYAIIGAVCGALGALVGNILRRLWHSAPRWVPIIFVAASPFISRQIVIPQINARALPELVTRNLEKTNPLFRAIFRYHPEAREAMLSGFREIMSKNVSQAELRSRFLGARISNHYLAMDLPKAADQAVFQLIVTNQEILTELRKNPKACVDFFSGPIDPRVISQSLMMKEFEAKAAIVQSSARAQAPAKSITEDEMGRSIVAAYKTKNFSVNEIGKLGNLKSVPAVDGCLSVIHFFSALVDMGPKHGSQVYRAILRAGAGTKDMSN